MESLDQWRKIFEGSGTDICNLIENAILVATSDCPTELSRKRDRIAQRLYASRFVRCCDRTSVTLADPRDETIDDEDAQEGITGCHDKTSDRVNSSIGETDGIRIINHRRSYDEAKDLTEEIEDESQALKEVFKIRDILANPDTSVTELYECLRRLELMQLTVESLKETQIGKQVNQLRKHNSKEIQSIVKRLIRGWKDTVDEWVKTTENVVAAATAVTSPGSVSPAMENDENGLPSPPLDEGAFLSTQMTSIEISQIFDDLDDDGNPHASEKTENDGYDDHYDVDGKQCTIKRPNKIKQSAHQRNLARDSTSIPRGEPETKKERGKLERNTQIQVVRDQGHKMSSSGGMVASSGHGRPPLSSKYKGSRDNVQPDLNRNQTKPDSFPLPNQKTKSLDDSAVKGKLQATKRKLQEGYQQVENAKKRRMIQVIELKELPKQQPVWQHHHQSMNKRR